MASKNEELHKRLLATFRIEADEHLKAMTSGLLALEKTSPGTEATNIIETVFREAHSLKGAARAVNLGAVESLCQALESVFALLKKAQLDVTVTLLDHLHHVLDELGKLLNKDIATMTSTPADISNLINRLEQIAKGVSPSDITQPARTQDKIQDKPTPPSPSPVSPAAAPAGTVRIATSKLDTVMRQVEELISPRLAASQRTIEIRNTAATVASWKKARKQLQPSLRHIERTTLRKDSSGSITDNKELRKLLNYLEEEALFISSLDNILTKLGKTASRDQRSLAGMTDSLLHDVKQMQLLPFDSLFELLPRLCRELARELGKEVELTVEGSEIEIDRRILEELKDPLIHLLRNAIDHGIETAPIRTAAGKPTQGKITLAVSQHDSGKIEIRLSDDGAGIHADKVKAAAHKQGLINYDEAELDESETFDLLFQSGISTSPIITDVSGRGLGLAIVREKAEQLGGSVSISSQPGNGTTFHIILPMTLATLRGVLVRAGEQLCVIPAAGVERAARIKQHNIRTVENRETITLDEQVISLVSLSDVLEMPAVSTVDINTPISVLILGQNTSLMAFRVDEILGEQEILVKNLGPQLVRVRNIAGASMLGTGQVVPVLNVSDLLKSAVITTPASRTALPGKQMAADAKQSILVAEDSITSRSLLKNILESAGYAVTTAVDGLDAFTLLKSENFDLIVSDVEMPRMDGFDLTAKIRSEQQVANVPVVLVTALETREHRERGIDVGANAYIVKSSFDQSNLLETIRRLI